MRLVPDEQRLLPRECRIINTPLLLLVESEGIKESFVSVRRFFLEILEG